MTHIDSFICSNKYYFLDTVCHNPITKFVFGGLVVIFGEAFIGHQLLIQIFVIIFLLDLLTGIAKALYFNIFSSRALFKGCMKLGVYAMLLIIFESLDLLIGMHIFMPIMLGFIIFTDSVSILENLEHMGFTFLRPLRKFLQVNKNEFIKTKMNLGDTIDVTTDFDKMKTKYIPIIKRKVVEDMFRIKIGVLEKFVYDISRLDTKDLETFHTQFNMLLSEVGVNIENELQKNKFEPQEIEDFLARHYIRVKEYISELEKLYNLETKGKDATVKHLKNNIIQATIRIIYKGISDNIDA